MIDLLLQDRKLSGRSFNWANWQSELTLKTCFPCIKRHGKIVKLSAIQSSPPLLHENCKCILVPMRTKQCGFATKEGFVGADVYVLIYKKLPNYYISRAEACTAGWKPHRGNLRELLPGKTIGGDVYQNREGTLPDAPGRIWHEADINYTGGFRGRDRLLYSNDGLLFVSYDHYKTFYEIIK